MITQSGAQLNINEAVDFSYDNRHRETSFVDFSRDYRLHETCLVDFHTDFSRDFSRDFRHRETGP